MDQRGKMLLGYSDSELADIGGYDLVHYDDLAYVASAHQECKFFFIWSSYIKFNMQLGFSSFYNLESNSWIADR